MMKTTKIFSTMVTSLMALTLLTSGGCTEQDENERVEKCGEGDIIRHGEYVLVNDDEPRSGYNQCIFDDPQDETFGWTWAATSQGSPNTYTTAFLFYGQADTAETPRTLWDIGSTTPALPISEDDLISLSIDYDVQVSSTSHYALTFNTSRVGCTVGLCMGAYLSIVIYSDYTPSSTDFQKRVRIDGEEYDFYKDSPVNSHSIFYRFAMVRPSYSGTLPFHKFLNFLANEGYGKFSEIKHIDFYQSMSEGGSGSTTIRKYKINVTSRLQ